MRRIRSTMFFVVLFMLLVGSVKADVIIDVSEFIPYETIKSVAWKENDLYILGMKGLYRCEEDSRELECLLDLTNQYPYYSISEEPTDIQEVTIWKQGIHFLCGDGLDIYGINQNSGEIFKLIGRSFEKVSCIPRSVLYTSDVGICKEITNVAYGNNIVYVMLRSDYSESGNRSEVYTINLLNNECSFLFDANYDRIIVLHPSDNLLCISESDNEIALYRNDTHEFDRQFNHDNTPIGTTWSTSKQKLVFVEHGRVKITDLHGETQTITHITMPAYYTQCDSACSIQDTYAIFYDNHILITNLLDQDYDRKTVLRVVGDLDHEKLLRYTMENPDIAIVTMNESLSVSDSALLRDNKIDLFVLSAPGNYGSFKDKGYIAPITRSELNDAAKTLYPFIQQVVLQDNKLMAFPIDLDINTWSVDSTVWQSLQIGKYPTSYSELLLLWKSWDELFIESYPDYVLTEFQQKSFDHFISTLIQDYIIYCEMQGNEVEFNSESFREVIENVFEIRSSHWGENSEPENILVYPYNMGMGVSYVDGHRIEMMIPPSMDANAPRLVNADLKVLAIHSESQNQQAAIDFLVWYYQELSITEQFKMFQHFDMPIESAVYSNRVNVLNRSIDDLDAMLAKETDSQIRESIIREILGIEAQIKRLEDIRWIISQESIDLYAQFNDKIKIIDDSPFLNLLATPENASIIYRIVSKYYNGDFEYDDVDVMLKEIDRVLWMIKYESS